jgi:NET1-associated nuclear protein 1 (U3 small nucleolar RNA-associated protein 17)
MVLFYHDFFFLDVSSSLKKEKLMISMYDIKKECSYFNMVLFHDCIDMKVSFCGEYLAILGSYFVSLYKITGKSLHYLYKLKLNRRGTCMTFHPLEKILVIGDKKGRITFYHGIDQLSSNQNPITTNYHWHAHQVNCIAFSMDGYYMLSGGQEAVLVIWQLQTGNKQFLPRLGSPIMSLSISSDQTMYGIGLKDNLIQLIRSSNLLVKCQIQGIQYDSISLNNNLLLKLNPKTQDIVLNGVSNCLQFYNFQHDTTTMKVSL